METSDLQPIGQKNQVTSWTCGWCWKGGGQSCGTEPLACGIWCGRFAWCGGKKKPHIRTGVRITVVGLVVRYLGHRGSIPHTWS